MPDNYYDDGGAGGAPQGAEATAPDEQAGGNTALLPKSLFGGKELKPGDTVTLKVSQVHEDEVAVEMSGDSEPAEQPQEQPQPAEAPAPGGGGGMASMLS